MSPGALATNARAALTRPRRTRTLRSATRTLSSPRSDGLSLPNPSRPRSMRLRYYTVPILTCAMGGVLLVAAYVLDSFACANSDQAAAMQDLPLCSTQQAQVATFAIFGAILLAVGAVVLAIWIRKYSRKYVDVFLRCPECGTSRRGNEASCRRCGCSFPPLSLAGKSRR